MAFYSPTSVEHGRISAVTATRILQRMIQGEDDNKSNTKNNGRKNGTSFVLFESTYFT